MFGFGIGCGLYAIIAKAWSRPGDLTIENVFAWPPSLGGAIGAIYGGFVELDDAIGDDKSASGAKKPEPKKLEAKKPEAKKPEPKKPEPKKPLGKA